MPIETAKEVTKVAVEASSTSGMWQWVAGIFSASGVGIAALWGHITGRIKALEDVVVSKEQLNAHTQEENEKFDNLFDEVRVIGKAVARIEGKLDK